MTSTSHPNHRRRREVLLSLAALGALAPTGLLAQSWMGTSTHPWPTY